MPFDSSRIADIAHAFEIERRTRELQHPPRSCGTIAPDDPGEPFRRPNGKSVQDYLCASGAMMLARQIGHFWHKRGHTITCRVELVPAKAGLGKYAAISTTGASRGDELCSVPSTGRYATIGPGAGSRASAARANRLSRAITAAGYRLPRAHPPAGGLLAQWHLLGVVLRVARWHENRRYAGIPASQDGP